MKKIVTSAGKVFLINTKNVKDVQILQGSRDVKKWYIKINFLNEKEGTIYGDWNSEDEAIKQASVFLQE